MPRGNYKAPYRAPFDPSITQAVETALRDAGRDDVIDLVRKSGMRELEHNLHKALERVHALELERVNWLTESGMFRALEERKGKIAVKFGKKAVWGLLGLAGSAATATVVWIAHHVAWK